MVTLAKATRIRVLLIVLVTFAGMAVFLWMLSQRGGPSPPTNRSEVAASSVQNSPIVSTSPATSANTPTVVTEATPSEPGASPSPGITPTTDDISSALGYVGTVKLVVPVAGVRPDQLLDTFTDARSEGRSHDAIDIPVPLGTPVVAAADGEITRLFPSEKGGTTIYQLSSDKKLILYYAHLQRYADGLVEGKVVKQGEVIGYVGDTGNAGAGNFHLHFSISIVPDPKRYWEGTIINPYPLLHK